MKSDAVVVFILVALVYILFISKDKDKERWY